MIKPWSISTAVRSPDRLRGFLSVLAQMEGERWNAAAQSSFQIRLIQSRLFGAHNSQFYRDLPLADIDLMESRRPISYRRAAEIFAHKNYETPSMRGRQSFKPLHKFGFVSTNDGHIRITETGKRLLEETKDYGDIFLHSLIKWQMPNPSERDFPAKQGYCIKPFVGTLRLIAAVNRLCKAAGEKEKGLSQDEFGIFVLTLIDWRGIEKTAEEIIAFRRELAAIPFARRHAHTESACGRLRPAFNLRHRRDYADNAVRYFRMTKYVSLRGIGGNLYIDLEPARKVELASLFKRDDASPIVDFRRLGGSYSRFIGSPKWLDLPGESAAELAESIRLVNAAIVKDGGEAIPVPAGASAAALKKLRGKVRAHRIALLKRKEKKRLRDPEQAAELVAELRQLAKRRGGGIPPSLQLEHLTARVLDDVLNDAREIRPNYPTDDHGAPATTAPGGVADIECHYENFDAVCEVTMLADSRQWMVEMQPVMRHLLHFARGRKHSVYCLFIAPKIHVDSFNTFRMSATGGYEGMQQKIAPVSIDQFCDIADECIGRMRDGREFSSAHIRAILDAICDSVRETQKSDAWMRKVPGIIEKWKRAA